MMLDVSLTTESADADGQSDAPSRAVIEAVADAEDADLLELPPLYEAIDPDALDGVFSGTENAAAGGRITFTYHGYQVQVDSDRSVSLEPADGRSRTNGHRTAGRRRD